ncbi:SAM-dependent methyltransferase [Fusarium beomiforme]|uniref:SAM-dependent methyltransferase n=1 Tax=Fusarium beomiforme TaxID=44412 RepID=A0A9P5AKC2_9HYPO|nr:SAM-dependent methyltransferase [Fusarium beomiforme]
MSTLALPSSSLPPLFTLSKISESDIFNALHYLAAIYCPLSFPFSKELGDSKHAFAEVDSGYTSGNEDDEGENTPASIRADVYEKSFAERWLTGFISRVETLEVFSSEEASQRALDQAAYIFESLFASALDEDDQNSPFLREFSFETRISAEEKKQISVQLNDGLAGTNDTDFEDVGLQSWGASIVFSDLMCTDLERFGLTKLSPTEHTRIIELGAGTGLVSLVLGKLIPMLGINDSKIIATDYHPAVLENLQSNILINYPKDKSPVRASQLDWADFTRDEPFDVPATMLFATDVVYAPEHARWLRDCATRLLSDDGVFWLLVTIRPNGKFAGIGNTVEAAFAETDRPCGEKGKRLDILERQKLDKRSGIGRGDESHYELFRIGWA